LAILLLSGLEGSQCSPHYVLFIQSTTATTHWMASALEGLMQMAIGWKSAIWSQWIALSLPTQPHSHSKLASFPTQLCFQAKDKWFAISASGMQGCQGTPVPACHSSPS